MIVYCHELQRKWVWVEFVLTFYPPRSPSLPHRWKNIKQLKKSQKMNGEKLGWEDFFPERFFLGDKFLGEFFWGDIFKGVFPNTQLEIGSNKKSSLLLRIKFTSEWQQNHWYLKCEILQIFSKETSEHFNETVLWHFVYRYI